MLKWFSKKKKEEQLAPLDFSVLKTDIHSHFIPGIDDGSPDMKTTISLIKEMQGLGFEKVITSPHVMSDFYKNTSETKTVGSRNHIFADLNLNFSQEESYKSDLHLKIQR